MKKGSKIMDLLALAVLMVFSVCVLLVLLTGTRIYGRMLDNGKSAFAARTGIRYITTRARQARSVSVQDFEGCSALVIPEEVDGERYTTMVYWYDGYICELYYEEGSGLYPEDGEKVIRAEEMAFSEKNGLIEVTFGSDRIFLNIDKKEIAL